MITRNDNYENQNERRERKNREKKMYMNKSNATNKSDGISYNVYYNYNKVHLIRNLRETTSYGIKRINELKAKCVIVNEWDWNIYIFILCLVRFLFHFINPSFDFGVEK